MIEASTGHAVFIFSDTVTTESYALSLTDALPITAAGVARGLTRTGRTPATPALIVENASRADERRIVTRLDGLADAAAALKGPALLIVGESMALAMAGEPGAGEAAAGEPGQVRQIEARAVELGGK